MWHLSLVSSPYTLIVSMLYKEDQMNSINSRLSVFVFTFVFLSVLKSEFMCFKFNLIEVYSVKFNTLKKKNNKQKKGNQVVSFLKGALFSPSQIIMCRLHLNYLLRSKYFRSTTVGEHYTIEVGARTVTAVFSISSVRCHWHNSGLWFFYSLRTWWRAMRWVWAALLQLSCTVFTSHCSALLRCGSSHWNE